MSKLNTVTVAHPNDPNGVMIINECDYDKEVHGPLVKGRVQLQGGPTTQQLIQEIESLGITVPASAKKSRQKLQALLAEAKRNKEQEENDS